MNDGANQAWRTHGHTSRRAQRVALRIVGDADAAAANQTANAQEPGSQANEEDGAPSEDEDDDDTIEDVVYDA